VEQRQPRRPEGAVQAPGDLGDSGSAPDAGSAARLALFDLGIDSKLRTCDLVKLRVRDVCHGDRLAARARVLQQETQRPVQFEITPPTREALEAWIKSAGLTSDGFLFPSRVHGSPHLGTRQ